MVTATPIIQAKFDRKNGKYRRRLCSDNDGSNFKKSNDSNRMKRIRNKFWENEHFTSWNKYPSLHEAVIFYGLQVEKENFHSARTDTEITCRILIEMIREGQYKFQERGIMGENNTKKQPLNFAELLDKEGEKYFNT